MRLRVSSSACLIFAAAALPLASARPEPARHDGHHEAHEHGQRCAHAHEVGEAIASRPVDQQVAVMTDEGEEGGHRGGLSQPASSLEVPVFSIATPRGMAPAMKTKILVSMAR